MSQYDVKIENIVNSVLEFFKIDRSLLFGKSRVKGVVAARHILAYCLREKYKLSFPVIGAMFNRDHTTIMHACENAVLLIGEKEELRIFVNSILNNEDEYEKIDDAEIQVESNEEDKKQSKEEKLKLQSYINEKNELERKEYQKSLKELLDKKNFLIKKAKDEYIAAIKELKQNKIKNRKEYIEALCLLKKSDSALANQYLSPKKELFDKFSYGKELKKFLPKYKEDTKEIGFPIKFSKEYCESVFKYLDERTGKIIINRYGLFNGKPLSLDELSIEEGVTRERIRQIIQTGINKIYFNNYCGLRQVVNFVAEKIIKEDIVFIKWCLNEYFVFSEEDEPILLKLILVMLLSIKWIKEFDFAGIKFFINTLNEKKIFEQIDHIKLLIEKIDSAMPDMVENRWEYILNNLKLYEFFQERKHLLNDEFLRACYDNYLFESEIVVYRTESLKKYRNTVNKELVKTSGIPDEYKVFFE